MNIRKNCLVLINLGWVLQFSFPQLQSFFHTFPVASVSCKETNTYFTNVAHVSPIEHNEVSQSLRKVLCIIQIFLPGLVCMFVVAASLKRRGLNYATSIVIRQKCSFQTCFAFLSPFILMTKRAKRSNVERCALEWCMNSAG